MITSIFNKSKPINYIIISFLMVLCYFIVVFNEISSIETFFEKLGMLLLLVFSMFITDFTVRRNNLSKDSSYSLVFYFIFLLFTPSVFDNPNIIISSFFILLGMRRLILLQSMLLPKEKIFDASLWIFIASLFHFWSILFIVLVFASIIYHVAGDYRNWILPIIAFFTTMVIFVFISMILDRQLIDFVMYKSNTSFDYSYFKTNIESVTLTLYGIFALVFLVSLMITLPKRPMMLHTSLKKIMFCLLIGVLVYIISPNKCNDLALFTLFPMTVLATNYVEFIKDNVFKNTVISIILTTGVVMFLLQL